MQCLTKFTYHYIIRRLTTTSVHSRYANRPCFALWISVYRHIIFKVVVDLTKLLVVRLVVRRVLKTGDAEVTVHPVNLKIP